MSLPKHGVVCSRCDFKAGMPEAPVRLHYRLDDGATWDARRETGWCYSCDTVTSIEDLPPIWLVERLLDGSTSGSVEAGEHEGLLKWLRRRKSLPRCLECGSEDNVRLKMGRADETRRIPVLGFRHGCGGMLYVVRTGVRVAWAFDRAPHVYLDEEGRVCEETAGT